MKRLLATGISAAMVPLMFWLGGFNFDGRGLTMLQCGILTIYVAIFVYWMPGAWE